MLLQYTKNYQCLGNRSRNGGENRSLTLVSMEFRRTNLTNSVRCTLQGERFGEHDELENRRLLWHGTNIAVVAAILKSGLRIMPHSGGRVGRGIYFASENSKSAGYGKSLQNIESR